jgi:blue copper oxidase
METMHEEHGRPTPTDLNDFVNPLRVPQDEGMMGVLDASDAPVHLTARWEKVEVLPGKETDLAVYRAERDGKVFLNPTFRAREGTRFSAELTNHLGAQTTMHWHGLRLDWREDGHPSQPVAAGASRRYAFPVRNSGGAYWYHPHPHGRTARQAYLGLAGLFLVEDEEDRRLNEALDLKFGETDVPLLLQDKTFDESGNLVYESGEMARSMGVEGDVVLVNLTPTPFLGVATRPYRFRLLNGSNARLFRLAFESQADGGQLPFSVVATDGNLMDRPRPATQIFLSPGERVDVILDLSKMEVGEEVGLRSLPFDPMHNEGGHDMAGMGHHIGSSGLPGGSAFYLLRLLVEERAESVGSIPDRLSDLAPPDASGAATRRIGLSTTPDSGALTRWEIAGREYEADEYPIVVRGGTTEVWEISNDERSMPHPMHLHGFEFGVLERIGSPPQVSELAVDGRGRLATDLGRKDTVLVWPGESVRIVADFSHGYDGEQSYLFHCHILEHEDEGMMINVKVTGSEKRSGEGDRSGS